MRKFQFFFILFLYFNAFSQRSLFYNNTQELYRSLHTLSNNHTLLCITAYPGEEDFQTLAYYRYKFGVNTYILYFTNGENQLNYAAKNLFENASGTKIKEIDNVNTILDSKYYRLNLPDPGYSKDLSRVLDLWDENKTERRLTYIFRLIQPDIILVSHNANEKNEVKRAVVKLVDKAFKNSSDPGKFTEQINNKIKQWQPVRLFMRINDSNYRKSAQFSVNVSEYDKKLGITYFNIALDAKKCYKSILNSDKMNYSAYYNIIQDKLLEKASYSDIFEDISESFSRSESYQDYLLLYNHRVLDNASIAYRIINEVKNIKNNPQHADTLYNHKTIQRLSNLRNAVSSLLQLKYEISGKNDIIVPTTEKEIFFNFTNSSGIDLFDFEYKIFPDPVVEVLSKSKIVFDTLTSDKTISKKLLIKLLKNPENKILDPKNKLKINGSFAFKIESEKIEISLNKSFNISPPVSIEIEPKRIINLIQVKSESFPVNVRISSNINKNILGTIKLILPAGWKCDNIEKFFNFQNQNDYDIFTFYITAFPQTEENQYDFKFDINILNSVLQKHQTGENIFTVTHLETQFPENLKIGIIQGYGNSIYNTLKSLTLNVSMIREYDFENITIEKYDTIIIGHGAYSNNPDLRKFYNVLLRFVRNGGHLIVLGQFPESWNKERGNPQFSPFEIVLSRQDVVDENSVVLELEPNNRIFSGPNKFYNSDPWSNWQVNRGTNFPEQWHRNYSSLISTYDKNEIPQNGGILLAEYGEGTYIYTCLSWERELFLRNIGAIKLFLNMAAYPKE